MLVRMTEADRPSGSLSINLLGGFGVEGPAPGNALRFQRKRSQALLAMLAISPRRTMPRGKVTAVLWEEDTESAARHRLRQCLFDLRRGLGIGGATAINAGGDKISLASPGLVVDVARFEVCAADGSPAALEEALKLYRGDLLDGFSLAAPAFEEWLRAERERLRSRAVTVMKALLAHHQTVSNIEEAIQVAVRLLAVEPFDEAAHRTLMRLYAESGRRSAALRQYEDCVELLARELGVEPETQTRELFRRLVAESPRLSLSPASVRRGPSPPAQSTKSALVSRSPGESALVGRKDDVAWLEQLTQRARRGQLQLALLFGEAGIGKSRLIDELASRVRRHARVLLGRSREGEDMLPFAPWVEALRPALTRDLVDRLPAVTRTDLTRLFVEFAGENVPPSTSVDDGLRIFEAVARLLRELSASRPLVIVLEDLHWCDDMTVRLLRFLARRLEGRRLLLVGTARPEDLVEKLERTVYLDILRGDPSSVSRSLAPLHRDEVKELFSTIAGRTDSPSAVLVDRVWAVSEGNPFVVVECARAVRERHAHEENALLDLPDGVRTLTARSLAKLSDRASRLADVAAVIGRDVDVKVLQHAAGVTEHEIADSLEELVRRRVLREVEGRFDFGHDRIREVVYGRLIQPRRALLHRQVGHAIEGLYAANLAPHVVTLAAHYRHAEDWPRACRYHAEAGFAALERGASREALACFDYALDTLSRLPDTEEWRELDVRVRLEIFGASLSGGSYEGGRTHLLHAERVAKTLPDSRWEGRVAVLTASCMRSVGELEQALNFGRKGLRIAVDTGDRSLEIFAKYTLTAIENNVGDFRRALELVEPIISEPDLRWDETYAINWLDSLAARARYWAAFSYIQVGEFDKARRVIDDGLRLLDIQTDVLQNQALLLHITHGRLLNAIGDFDGAVRAYDKGFAAYRDECHGNFYGPLAWGRALAYALAGRVRESLEQFETAEAVALRHGSRPFAGMWFLHLGRALLAADRLDEASDIAHKVLGITSKNCNGPGEAGALGLLGEVAMRRDPLPTDEMENYVVRALALAERMEMRPLAARCHLRLAWLCSRLGRTDAARHRVAAKSLLEQMGQPRSLDAAGVH